jgi:hypothetical protein
MLSNELFLSALVVGMLVVVAAIARRSYTHRVVRDAVAIVKRVETSESDLYHADRDLRRAVQLFRTAKFKRDTGQRADPVRAAKALAQAYRLQQLMDRTVRASGQASTRVPKSNVRRVARMGA